MEETGTNENAEEFRDAKVDVDTTHHHLIKKCLNCQMWQGKNNVCFAKGHPQLIRTVRRAEDGVHYELVSSGEIMSAAADGHFYYRIKPGSRILAWDDGTVVEVSTAEVEDRLTICLAPGTVLQRASQSKRCATGWLNDSGEPLIDYVIPTMPKPRLAHNDVKGERKTQSQDEGEHTRDDSSQPRGKSKRRKSRKLSDGPRKRAASAGGGAGDAGSSVWGSVGGGTSVGGAGGAPEEATDVTPSLPYLVTKDEVQRALEEKLNECDEREAELKRVIDKANAELDENNERRKRVVADSDSQVLAIIAKREAYAAHCEELAAQARAQNISDRESLRARHQPPAPQQLRPESAASSPPTAAEEPPPGPSRVAAPAFSNAEDDSMDGIAEASRGDLGGQSAEGRGSEGRGAEKQEAQGAKGRSVEGRGSDGRSTERRGSEEHDAERRGSGGLGAEARGSERREGRAAEGRGLERRGEGFPVLVPRAAEAKVDVKVAGRYALEEKIRDKPDTAGVTAATAAAAAVTGVGRPAATAADRSGVAGGGGAAAGVAGAASVSGVGAGAKASGVAYYPGSGGLGKGQALAASRYPASSTMVAVLAAHRGASAGARSDGERTRFEM